MAPVGVSQCRLAASPVEFLRERRILPRLLCAGRSAFGTCYGQHRQDPARWRFRRQAEFGGRRLATRPSAAILACRHATTPTADSLSDGGIWDGAESRLGLQACICPAMHWPCSNAPSSRLASDTEARQLHEFAIIRQVSHCACIVARELACPRCHHRIGPIAGRPCRLPLICVRRPERGWRMPLAGRAIHSV